MLYNGITSIIMWGVAMKNCTFLSTDEEKIECFEECPFYKLEDEEESCPFKNPSLLKKPNIKDYQFDYLKEEEAEFSPFPKVYKEEFD